MSRTSCVARVMSTDSLNSTTVSLRPSKLLERIILTPAMPLRASSSGLVISVSTAPGDAPGYCTEMKTTGGEMSGICSTPSRWYENNPSTHRATMTMVAKTGLLMETRVIHMGTLLE